MGKLIVGFLAGLILGGVGAIFMSGGAMGVGAATGLSAGICSIVEAAEQTQMMTPDQIEQVLVKAIENMKSVSDDELPGAVDGVATVADCKTFMANLRAGK